MIDDGGGCMMREGVGKTNGTEIGNTILRIMRESGVHIPRQSTTIS
jgi:hypothetical protein